MISRTKHTKSCKNNHKSSENHNTKQNLLPNNFQTYPNTSPFARSARGPLSLQRAGLPRGWAAGPRCGPWFFEENPGLEGFGKSRVWVPFV